MIGVLVSGEGTNLQALIDARLPIACVASNTPDARGLERARAQHDGGLTQLKTDPTLRRLRGDPRYAALLRKLNLPPG